MGYPSLEQYQEALQHPRTALVDPELRDGTIATSGLGLPMVMCGGFALTYTVKAKSTRYAVRCFHRDSPDLQKRYQAISAKLAQLASPYFLPFEFQPQGVRIAGKAYPIVKMTWASGETLGDFVANNYRNGAALASLRRSLTTLAEMFEPRQIAHGDIQPGNLMVANRGSAIQLIDYDGMFVPAIEALGPSEIGHRNFQHPRRSKQFDFRLDRFSLICLDVALSALASDSKLWDDTQSDSETFLFRANDFADPASSPIFQKLMSGSVLGASAKALAAICSSEMERTPTLADFLSSKNIPQMQITVRSKPAQPAAYISQYDVLDATSYDSFVRKVGSMVELVGKVTDVKEGYSRRGRGKYLFVNFGNWRGNIVKLTVWSAALPKVESQVTSALVGSWVSVVGLVEPPYVSKKFKYSHISVDITGPSQVRVISAEQAKFRLGGKGDAGVPGDNQSVLSRLRGETQPRSRAKSSNSLPTSAPATNNAAVLARMRQSQGGVPPAGSQSNQTNQSRAPSPIQRPSGGLSAVPWWVWVGGALLALWLLGK
jgi:hypothetical protein